jgi:hypothetical protein
MILVWPETPKCKGKRQTEERQPFALTYGKYREVFERNFLARRQKKTKKNVRKGRHEEAKLEKKNK